MLRLGNVALGSECGRLDVFVLQKWRADVTSSFKTVLRAFSLSLARATAAR